MGDAPILVWFRQDLRLRDHPALSAAAALGPVVPVYLWSPEEEGPWAPGSASRWWLHHSLRRLGESLRERGTRLVLRRGPALETLRELVAETGARFVYWSRRYEPALRARDEQIRAALLEAGAQPVEFKSALLLDPEEITNRSGRPFQVFTPFWKTALERVQPPSPLRAPRLRAPARWPSSLPLEALGLEPRHAWADGLRAAWEPGEDGGQAQLRRFVAEALHGYAESRNRPDQRGTSRLSPHLHFGELSPGQVWAAIRRAGEGGGMPEPAWRSWAFVTELGWREFAHHLLVHFPATPSEPLRPEFARFPWRRDPEALRAWQRGRTGYPIVDAGMRELWATGWMHNRVRMIVASFLVKDLLIRWQEGAQWFWDTLVDADLANNTLGWQWSAGCGADAAPYFRVFNPTSQGEKFDPAGDYVRRWVPELGRLPQAWIHRPWEAPPEVLQAANVRLGPSYPEPIVSHTIAREIALEAYQRMRQKR